ncbi:MAG: zinc ribbon domain-containing protein [bacterium]|nr:zinc ribbon domain-containing protein [bacterium]
MNCKECGSEIPAGMSFCGKCGEKIEVAGDGLGPGEVSGAWLKQLLESEEFEVEVDDSDCDQLVATHAKRPNQIVQIKRDFKIVSLQSPWSLKKRMFGGKDGILNALNKANASSWYSTFYVDFDSDRLTTSFYIQLSSQLSGSDFLGLLEKAEEDFFRILNSSGLSEHLA